MFIEQKLKYETRLLLIISITLTVLGLLFVYSSSSFYAFEMYKQPLYFVQKQCIGIILGLLGFFIAKSMPLSFFKQTSFFLFITTILLTIATLTPLGFKIHGSQRWLSLFHFTFQPSELIKVALVLYLASFLSRKKITEKNILSTLPLIGLIGITSLILLMQPDFGCMIAIGATTLIMFFLAQLPIKYFIGSIAIATPFLFLLIYLQPYRWQRILTFLDPWQDPQGTGFQIIQALIAEGSGGLWGTGISQSKQKFLYLPMQHTDFIFAIIAEEIGYIGSLFFITLFVAFLLIGFRISWSLKDAFSIFLVQGITIMISLQAIINLLVTTGLAPTKGIGLPFISYGNTALVCNMILLGLMINAIQDY
ncbi:putative lipid II flippase FtsW [Candidatus Dependentiae bacterium]|nr:putative lipid II flippase FtsW [Candidatus Dependentiae bacterium]